MPLPQKPKLSVSAFKVIGRNDNTMGDENKRRHSASVPSWGAHCKRTAEHTGTYEGRSTLARMELNALPLIQPSRSSILAISPSPAGFDVQRTRENLKSICHTSVHAGS
jgi:hypothetical protein